MQSLGIDIFDITHLIFFKTIKKKEGKGDILPINPVQTEKFGDVTMLALAVHIFNKHASTHHANA